VIAVGIGLVVGGMDNARIFVDRDGAVAVRVIVMLDGIAAWIARMRAENRDQPGDDSANQRQKDDCLDHARASLRMIFPENRCPLFRIMR
jgi:hypothetical protein